MKKSIYIVGLIGTITTNVASAIDCDIRQHTYSQGYETNIYQSEYISEPGRCQTFNYYYFYQSGTNNICLVDYTRNINVTVYIASSADNTMNRQILGTSHDPIYGYTSCKTCTSGYHLVKLATLTDTNTGSSAYYEVYGCGKCTGTDWQTDSSDASRETRNTCSSIDATPTKESRCAEKFYGNGSTCNVCPPITGQTGPSGWGYSVAGENTAITDCYLEPGTYTDTTGTFKIQSDCPYKN